LGAGQRIVNRRKRNMTRVATRTARMGKVPIWAQWLMIAAGVLSAQCSWSLLLGLSAGRAFAGYGRFGT
jgi:hypothetical protein